MVLYNCINRSSNGAGGKSWYSSDNFIFLGDNSQPLHLPDYHHRDRHRGYHPHGDLWPDEQPLDALGAALHLQSAALHAGSGKQEKKENHSTPRGLEQVK